MSMYIKLSKYKSFGLRKSKDGWEVFTPFIDQKTAKFIKAFRSRKEARGYIDGRMNEAIQTVTNNHSQYLVPFLPKD